MILVGLAGTIVIVVIFIVRDAGWRPASRSRAWLVHTAEVAAWTVFALLVLPQLIQLVA